MRPVCGRGVEAGERVLDEMRVVLHRCARRELADELGEPLLGKVPGRRRGEVGRGRQRLGDRYARVGGIEGGHELVPGERAAEPHDVRRRDRQRGVRLHRGAEPEHCLRHREAVAPAVRRVVFGLEEHGPGRDAQHRAPWSATEPPPMTSRSWSAAIPLAPAAESTRDING